MNNREILFRGKRTDNGEWILGKFLDENHIGIFHDDTETEDCWIEIFQVIPETVGQYTGLTDKNGKKIFEGDILKRMGTSQTMLYTVNWNHKFAMFILPCVTHEIMENDFMSLTGTAFEVIGNIYDNSELIGGN